MRFGPVPPRQIPQQDPAKVLLLAERWQRAAWAHRNWAERAKTCVDFFEGRQWTEKQLTERKGRPSFKWNMIAPLVRLIMGYHGNNKTDITFQPGSDARSSEDVAKVLSMVEKAIAKGSALEFVDVEVFMDGLLSGRGFYDTRLDFEDNDLGEIKTKAIDPFSTYIDPDADTYDLNETASYIQQARWTSIDEIEGALGKQVAELVRPFTMGQTPLAPLSTMAVNDEITPIRAFGEKEDMISDWWETFYSLSGEFVDTHRKTIRIIETQYKVRERRNVIIDLETGDKKTLPENWNREKIEKVLFYCEQIGNPCIVQPRMVERIHWTTMAGDVILYDAPSMYEGYTTTGYFPYFRRGMTRGMVEDLVDPQLNKNKHRNAEIEIVSKTANGGFKYHESSLSPKQKLLLKKFGSQPGFNLEWKGEKEPKVIEAAGSALKHERLEKKDDDDMRSISGINESALGELDRVQSGRAIEARQRQAVMSVQTYMDNQKRSKMLLGNLHLSMVQNHYTEQRLFRIMGEDGKFVPLLINKAELDPATGVQRVLNDITVGKYTAIVDPSPLSATFANAQFEEMLLLLEKMGPALGPVMPMFADLIMDMSSLPRKDEWIERFKQVMGGAGAQQPGSPGGPGAPPDAPLPVGGPGGGAGGPGGNVIPFNAATMQPGIPAGAGA